MSRPASMTRLLAALRAVGYRVEARETVAGAYKAWLARPRRTSAKTLARCLRDAGFAGEAVCTPFEESVSSIGWRVSFLDGDTGARSHGKRLFVEVFRRADARSLAAAGVDYSDLV